MTAAIINLDDIQATPEQQAPKGHAFPEDLNLDTSGPLSNGTRADIKPSKAAVLNVALDAEQRSPDVAVAICPPVFARKVGGQLQLVDGWQRVTAAIAYNKARTQESPRLALPVKVLSLDDSQAITRQTVSNTASLKVGPDWKAMQARKMLDDGRTKEYIATRLGLSGKVGVRMVNNYLMFEEWATALMKTACATKPEGSNKAQLSFSNALDIIKQAKKAVKVAAKAKASDLDPEQAEKFYVRVDKYVAKAIAPKAKTKQTNQGMGKVALRNVGNAGCLNGDHGECEETIRLVKAAGLSQEFYEGILFAIGDLTVKPGDEGEAGQATYNVPKLETPARMAAFVRLLEVVTSSK